MFCTKCGSQVEDGLKFCPKCGNSLSAGGKDQHSDGKSSAKKSGIAAKVVEVVIGVLLAAGFFAYKYYTSGMSIESLERQSAELVQGAIADSEIAKFLKFEKTENLVLQKQEKDHYTGTTWVWFNRKTNPNRVPVRFKYSLDVKLSDGRVYLETKPEDGESERMVEFIGGGEEDGETESAGVDESAEAVGLKTFVGVTFGTKPTADKFEGPDEDGDFTFKPTLELGAFQVASVSVEDNTKLIDTITLAQGFDDINSARKFLEFVNQNVRRCYSQYGLKEQEQGTSLWNEFVKGYAAAGVKYTDLRIFATSNDDGSVNQYVSTSLIITESGVRVAVSATDNTVGQQQSDGVVGYTGVTPEGSERIIAQWDLFENSQDMTQLQKEAEISKLVGVKVAVRGIVENVGTTIDGGLYVTVKNERLRQSAFWAELLPDSKEMAMSLKKGDPVVLYASLTKPLVQLLPGLVLTQGYIVRQESDAKVGSDGNETDNSADKLSKEYETILREAMPIFMSMQGLPKDKLDAMVAEELKKEMKRFCGLAEEKKNEELKRAREEILPKARALKEGGSDAAAVLKEATDNANASAQAMRGRNLFVAITLANTEREAAGVASVWPKSRYTKTTVADDISSKLFETSTEYFNALFDIRNHNKSDWKPYIDNSVDLKCAFSPDTMSANWHIAQGVSDDLEDCVPVLVSSNVDVSSLVTQPGQYKASAQTGRLRFSGTCAVIIRKGGAAEVIKEKDASLAKVYGNNFSLPKGFGYLSPIAK